jgi:hypothetical protein
LLWVTVQSAMLFQYCNDYLHRFFTNILQKLDIFLKTNVC